MAVQCAGTCLIAYSMWPKRKREAEQRTEGAFYAPLMQPESHASGFCLDEKVNQRLIVHTLYLSSHCMSISQIIVHIRICICPRATYLFFCKTLLTPRRLIVLNDVGKLEEWHLWVSNRASAFSLVDSGGYAVGQLNFWTVLLWMIIVDCDHFNILTINSGWWLYN